MARKKKKKKKKNTPSNPSDRAFSWYPGHMVKAKRELEENLKLSDAVLLMLDARAPISTRHADLEAILNQRSTPFVLILNKVDLAEPEETARWRSHLSDQGHYVVEMNSLHGRGAGPLTSLLDKINKDVNSKRKLKGLLPREPRLMVAGLPNSGKSTLLNRLVGKNRFKAGKKPGLTRGAQWVKVANQYQLLDTPGILYPRIEGEVALSVLAATSSVKRDVLPKEKVAQNLLRILHERGRLLEFIPQFEEFEEDDWIDEPLLILTEVWGFFSRGDYGPTGSAFERLLNLLSSKKRPITWETVDQLEES